MYFEDFDISGQASYPDGTLDVADFTLWLTKGRADIASYLVTEDDLCLGNLNLTCIDISVQAGETTYLAPRNITPYTWGDVSFVIEIADGLGTGSRRAREARLQQLDDEKKKRLIRLICRVKGEETAYDETKQVGDIQLKLDDVDMVISKVTKLNVSGMHDWEEVPWNYEYDK